MQCLSPPCPMASAPLPDGSHLPGLEVEMERQWVRGKEMPQIPHESGMSSYKLCTTITSFTTDWEPGIELEVLYSRKCVFLYGKSWWGVGGERRGRGVWWWWWGVRSCVYTHAFLFFLWTVHSQPPFLRAVHGACGVRRYKAAFF